MNLLRVIVEVDTDATLNGYLCTITTYINTTTPNKKAQVKSVISYDHILSESIMSIALDTAKYQLLQSIKDMFLDGSDIQAS